MGVADWFEIRVGYASGLDLDDLARTYQVTRAAIVRRAQREGWPRVRRGSIKGGGPVLASAAGADAPVLTPDEEAAALQQRHRRQWAEHGDMRRDAVRIILDQTYRPDDAPENWDSMQRLRHGEQALKMADLDQRGLALAHEGERRAYGIVLVPRPELNAAGELVVDEETRRIDETLMAFFSVRAEGDEPPEDGGGA